MKILHVIDSGGLYGAEQVLLALVEAQIEQGLEPMILSVTVPESEPKALVQEAQRRLLPVTAWPMAPGFNLKGAVRLMSWSHKQGYQLLHSHGYRFDILLNCIPRGRDKPLLISTVHGFTASSGCSRLMFYQWLNRLCLLRADRVVAVSQQLQQQLRHKAKVVFIPNGIAELSPEQQEVDVALPDAPFLIALGRLSPEKGYLKLVDAFADSRATEKGWHLVIAGEGDQKTQLLSKAQERGVSSRVHLIGYTHCARVWLKNAVALVIASETEGLPMVLLEAMQMKTVVIATPVGEIPEVLNHGELGFLAAACDQQSLTDCINRCIAEPEQVAVMQQSAFRRFEKHYTAIVMAERYHAIYRELLEHAGDR